MAQADAPERISDDVLEDLRRRLASTRRINLIPGTGWDRGTDTDYLTELLDYWGQHYDWRPHEDRIRALPWVTVEVGGMTIRAVHQHSPGATDTVVLLHGWPDSVLRFDRLLPLLSDVNVVIPCLPGFPFAPALTETGVSATAVGGLFVDLMAELGYDSYVVSGGDIGSSVAQSMAMKAPDAVSALHLTDIPFRYIFTVDPADLTPEEREYLDVMAAWQQAEGAYGHQQSTKPHSLAVGLGDSPAGLAAWIVEKLRGWSDCDGDVESVFPREDLLTWLTAYWVTGTIGTSFTPYVEPREPAVPVATPTVITYFEHELLHAPRAYAERIFNVQQWVEHPEGGHFAAWECPELFAAGVRSAIDVQAR